VYRGMALVLPDSSHLRRPPKAAGKLLAFTALYALPV
jgi:hypothetical protein